MIRSNDPTTQTAFDLMVLGLFTKFCKPRIRSRGSWARSTGLSLKYSAEDGVNSRTSAREKSLLSSLKSIALTLFQTRHSSVLAADRAISQSCATSFTHFPRWTLDVENSSWTAGIKGVSASQIKIQNQELYGSILGPCDTPFVSTPPGVLAALPRFL